jgi:serine/threonine protein kinase
MVSIQSSTFLSTFSSAQLFLLPPNSIPCHTTTIPYLQGQGSLIEVKIADFGLSALVRIGEDGYDVEESSKRKKYKGLTEMWGTKEYFAPELIDQAYGPQADLWALGCILFEMLCGHQGTPSRSPLIVFLCLCPCLFDGPAVLPPPFSLIASPLDALNHHVSVLAPHLHLSVPNPRERQRRHLLREDTEGRIRLLEVSTFLP